MLIGTIRPIETRTVEVTGPGLPEIQEQLTDLVPEGIELANAPAEMTRSEAAIKTTATFQRVDRIREIEADDMTTLEAKVPDAWQLLSVRRVH